MKAHHQNILELILHKCGVMGLGSGEREGRSRWLTSFSSSSNLQPSEFLCSSEGVETFHYVRKLINLNNCRIGGVKCYSMFSTSAITKTKLSEEALLGRRAFIAPVEFQRQYRIDAMMLWSCFGCSWMALNTLDLLICINQSISGVLAQGVYDLLKVQNSWIFMKTTLEGSYWWRSEYDDSPESKPVERSCEPFTLTAKFTLAV